MADISAYIKRIESAVRGEDVRDAIIDALNAINDGGNVLSLNGHPASYFVTKAQFDAVFPLNETVEEQSTKGVESHGIWALIRDLGDAIDNYINKRVTEAETPVDKLVVARNAISDIADAIRAKGGNLTPYAALTEYANAISNLQVSQNYNLTTLNVTKNDEYAAEEGQAWRTVKVDVKPRLLTRTISRVDYTGKASVDVTEEHVPENSDEERPYGYSRVNVDISNQLTTLNLKASGSGSGNLPDTPEELAHTIKASEWESSTSEAEKIGFSEVNIDITDKLKPLEIKIDATYGKEDTYIAADGDGFDGGGSLYGYSSVRIRVVESDGPFTVKFWDEHKLLDTVEGVEKHQSVTYSGGTPKKADKVFDGWNPTPYDVVTDLNCYAQWKDPEETTNEDGSINGSWSKIAQNGGADIEVGGWKDLSIPKTQFGSIEIAGKTIKITKVASGVYGCTSIWESDYYADLPFYDIKQWPTSFDQGSSDVHGYQDCDLAQWLDSTLMNAIAQGESDPTWGSTKGLTSAIKSVTLYTTCFDSSDGGKKVGTSSHKIWLIGYKEAGGGESFDGGSQRLPSSGHAGYTRTTQGYLWETRSDWYTKYDADNKPMKDKDGNVIKTKFSVPGSYTLSGVFDLTPLFNSHPEWKAYEKAEYVQGLLGISDGNSTKAYYATMYTEPASTSGSTVWSGIHPNLLQYAEKTNSYRTIRVRFCFGT